MEMTIVENEISTEGEFKNGEWYIFNGFGPTAITCAFAEVIHLTTTKRVPDHIKTISDILLANTATRQANEALSHLIADNLALEIAKELGIPNATKRVEASYQRLIQGQDYRLLPEARKWINKPGIGNQNAFDFYMENPQKFLEQILQNSK